MQHSNKPNGCRNHADRSSACLDVQSIAHEMETPVDKAGTISMCQIESKQPDPLTIGTNDCTNETDDLGSYADMSSGHSNMPSIQTDVRKSENKGRIIGTHQMDSKMQNSHTCEITALKCTYQRKRVSIGDGDGDVQPIMPINTTS